MSSSRPLWLLHPRIVPLSHRPLSASSPTPSPPSLYKPHPSAYLPTPAHSFSLSTTCHSASLNFPTPRPASFGSMSLHHPIAPIVGEQYCAPFPLELTVSKKVVSLSGGSFDITDADGQVLFKMDGHAFSIRDKRVLLDAEGCPILCAHKKVISLHDKWEVSKGDHFEAENKLFTVKKSSLIQFKTALDVFLVGNENNDCPDFTVKGNFFEREAKILQGDRVIAELKRKFSVGNVLLDKHTFVTAVCPGIDQAFIATLVVIMDAIHED